MSELKKLIERARYCRNTGEPFIWDNSWLNECSQELAEFESRKRTLDEAIEWHEGDRSPHAELEQTIVQLRAELGEAKEWRTMLSGLAAKYIVRCGKLRMEMDDIPNWFLHVTGTHGHSEPHYWPTECETCKEIATFLAAHPEPK
jgi:hypothetical protein